MVNVNGGLQIHNSFFSEVRIPIPDGGIKGFIDSQKLETVFDGFTALGDHIETAAVQVSPHSNDNVYIFTIPRGANFTGEGGSCGYMKIKCITKAEFSEEYNCSPDTRNASLGYGGLK